MKGRGGGEGGVEILKKVEVRTWLVTSLIEPLLFTKMAGTSACFEKYAKDPSEKSLKHLSFYCLK